MIISQSRVSGLQYKTIPRFLHLHVNYDKNLTECIISVLVVIMFLLP